VYSFNIVELEPPAPAALVLLGRALAALSLKSAAALRRIAVAGPPGAFGEVGRAVVEPALGCSIGEAGEDCESACVSLVCLEEVRALELCVGESGVSAHGYVDCCIVCF
jgi:hypothetical protein